MGACPRGKHYNAVKKYFFELLKSLMVFWNEATFVTYGWNGQDRKA